MCAREEKRERKRERVNNIKKCKKKKKAVVRKKAKIYLQTKDTHLGDAQSTIQFGKHVRKWSRCSARIYESKSLVD